ncbi:MAG: putative sugar O-methyltransferase [Nitrospirae bacterium]|nr:putative sugar O-methyltransferase [Nitrospirota bacterium]
MKILFVGRSVYHFTYYESIIRHLHNNGNKVKLIFDKEWSKDQPDHALKRFLEETGVFCGWALRRNDKWRKYIFASRELLSFSNYVTREGQSEFYLRRWQKYLSPILRKMSENNLIKRLFGSRLVQLLLINFEKLVPPCSEIVDFLKKKKPDVIVASPVNMRFSEELEYIKAAKSLGLPTVIHVLSWDNLTTKGLVHIAPSAILAWNKAHLNEAAQIHHIPESQIIITGSPFFDKWFDEGKHLTDREAFCNKTGLNSKLPFVTYLGSSKNIAGDEVPLLMSLIAALRESGNPMLRNIGVLVRPHPANAEIYENLREDNVVLWPKQGSLPDSPEAVTDFLCSLKYAVASIGINTSGMIDSVILDTPCIALMTGEYSSTQTNTTHFNHLVKSSALYTASDVNELPELLLQLMGRNDPNKAHRLMFVKNFIRPYGSGVSAGEVAAAIIEMTGRKQTRGEIDDYLLKLGRRTESINRSPEHTAFDLPVFIETARNDRSYQNYLAVLERVHKWLGQSHRSGNGISSYWLEELAGFDYMLDASPLIIRKLREHCYHITGLKSYEYRVHHSHAKPAFEWKLKELKKLDGGKYFIPENPAMGGFGHIIDGALVNIDTLKFYEALLALNKAGIIADFSSDKRRKTVLEIGGGWGGFAYQIKTILPDTCYIIIDLPQTFLFSATYLKTLFPDAKFLFYGDTGFNDKLKNCSEYDFIFLPHYSLSEISRLNIDLAVNMISFQEMTSEQVNNYAGTVYKWGCTRLYSFNRERSKHNSELTTVSSIIGKYYDLAEIEMLDMPYNVLTRPKETSKPGKAKTIFEYRHLTGRRRNEEIK